MVKINDRLKPARDCQKSYADVRRKPLEFQIGDRAILYVSAWKGIIRFGKQGKIIPRYIGPFEILERTGHVTYKLKLPQDLDNVDNVCHISYLKRCLYDDTLDVHLDEIQINTKLNFIEELVETMDREIKRLKQIRFPIVKVRWNSLRGPKFTWERVDQKKQKYPQPFKSVLSTS